MDTAQTGGEPSQDEILSEILKKFSSSGAFATDRPSAQDTSQTGAGDMLSAFLSNPELIAKLPSIVATVRPIIEMLGKTSSLSSSTASPPPPPPVESVPAALGLSGSHSSDSRTALLCAIKPYLGSERQNAIDYVIKLGRLGEILKTL